MAAAALAIDAAQCLSELQQGSVIAYATEAVYGLGCDPDNQGAVEILLELKQRPIEKGLIIVAGELSQLANWIDVEAVSRAYPHVLDSWPGHSTWLLPCKTETPKWLTGQFDTLAVRISAHPDIKKLCTALGKGLVSTSANPAGQSPARSAQQALEYFPHVSVLEGAVDELAQPSVIRDAQTQKIIRS